MSGKRPGIGGVCSVVTFLFFFYLCLFVRPGVGHGNESPNPASNNRANRSETPNGAGTSPPDPQRHRSEETKQIEAIMFRMFEDHLLANLDFENLPRPVNTSLPPVPDYMFRLYQHLKVDTKDIFHETIRGYHVMKETWQRPGLRYLVFNTTSQPLKENITHVELVVYMCPSSTSAETQENNDNATTTTPEDATPPTTAQQHVNVTITMVTKRRRRHNKIHLRLPVNSNRSSLPINITKMVQKSFAKRRTILNFSIETSSIAHPSIPQQCQSSSGDQGKRPLLVIYENILPFPESRDDDNSRQKRGVSTVQNATTTQEPTNLPTIQIRSEINRTDPVGNNTNTSDPDTGSTLLPVTHEANSTNASPGSYPVNCHLRSWYVNFSEMQWQHVILHPPGYNANYCWGVCPALLDNLNSTNHAFVRSKYMLLQRLDPDIPKPFCSPIRMSSITLLYRNKYDVVITKKFSDMVAAECSCM